MMVLYVGFIFCFPSGLRRKLWFSLLGLAFIYIINVFRCVGLVLIAHDNDLRKWFDFAHHYLFVIIVYGFIFLLWMWFVNGIGRIATGQVKQSRENEIA
jgi:exosortase/archaeosortase family protein